MSNAPVDAPEAGSQRELAQAIFLGAASLTRSAERRAYVKTACGDDLQLRSEVEGMLAAQADSDDFFARGLQAIGQLTMTEAIQDEADQEPPGPEELPDIDPGRFKLLQKIGEGGCAVVYMADQQVPIHRRVALKVIKLGMDTKSVVARFEAEQQALALMEHPGIARVFEAGATAHGRPYFVMELVKGIQLTDYCDQNQLDARQRLELFLGVCGAIQHAHQKGIIHRDIKPSNILVTLHDGVAVPKVIDFGIAKAIQGKLTDQTLFTAYDQFIGTPAYMSPEQAVISALDVDTRSDIYSLGVLLYELLTGRPPFETRELMKEGLDEWRQTLRHKEPQRPSLLVNALQGEERQLIAGRLQTEPPQLISLLKGDLDWIVMKALEKDRRRRYETANELANDVRRHLDNEPVMARPPSRLYRLQKLVRRNRGVFAAGSAVAAALIAGMAVSTAMFFKARTSEHREAELRQIAERAEVNETLLRREAETRTKLSEAALLATHGKHEEAARLLEDVTELPSQPTLDAVLAYRSIGEFLALRQEWNGAAKHFASLIEIDEFDDWPVITLDYQSLGVALVESGDHEAYEAFRRMAVARFSGKDSVHPASRILKVCLFQPLDDATLQDLTPMGESVAEWIEGLDRQNLNPWVVIPISLWKLRCGDDETALEYCRLALDVPNVQPACQATVRLIAAMAYKRSGETDEALDQFTLGREAVEAAFHSELHRGESNQEMWYDWTAARILLCEAADKLGISIDGRE